MTPEEVEYFNNECLTDAEKKSVEIALKERNPWNHKAFSNELREAISEIKNKLKEYHLPRVKERCCYCRRQLNDAKIEQDREHIIPKSRCKALTYNVFNISISCKRCNMDYKKESVEHISDMSGIDEDYMNPDRYLIPHPNIDKYTDHLSRKSFEEEDLIVCSYEIRSDKGRFLYEFLRLDKLCVDEFDVAQGGRASPDDAPL